MPLPFLRVAAALSAFALSGASFAAGVVAVGPARYDPPARAVEAVLGSVTEALQRGDAVALSGFGTFQSAVRAARTGRNPRTGETLAISASRVPKFKPGKSLKDALK